MKKRTGLALAGGILEIIAGTYLLIYALWALSFYLQIPNGLELYNWEMLIIFGVLIFFGIMAIIGKTKKDLVNFGILNLLYVGMLIYRAIQTNTTNIIWIFSFEMILLVIASMFFFFSKKSEYEIVFNEKLNIYKENEPQEHKKLKNIFIGISSAVIILLQIAIFLKLVGIVIDICLIIGYITMCVIITKKNQSSYKFKANIIFTSIAMVIALVCSGYVAINYSYTASSYIISHVQTKFAVEDTYLYYNNDNSSYLILHGEDDEEYSKVYYAYDSVIYFNTLPEGSILITEKWGYFDPTTNEDKFAYKFYNTSEAKNQYYLQDGQIVDNLPEFTIINEHPEINKSLMIIISCGGALIGLIIILGTRNAQLEIDVNKQLKEEERKRTYERYK